MFLDELDPNRGDDLEVVVPYCSLVCQIEFQEIMDRQVNKVFEGKLNINQIK